MSSKVCSIVALVCGVIGVVFAWWGYIAYFAFVCAIVGIIFGAIGMKKAKEENAPKGLAVAGLVCGIVGTVLGFIGVLCVSCALCIGATAVSNSGDLSSSLNELSSLLS